MKVFIQLVSQVIIEADDEETALEIAKEQNPNSYIKNHSIESKEDQEMLFLAYIAGYKAGKVWLSRGETFKHYNDEGGYVPGGPGYFSKKYPSGMNSAWSEGWKNGIDSTINVD